MFRSVKVAANILYFAVDGELRNGNDKMSHLHFEELYMIGKAALLSLVTALVGTTAFTGTAEAAFIDVQASLYTPLVPNGTGTVIDTQNVKAPSNATLSQNGYSLSFNNIDANQGIVNGALAKVHAIPVSGVQGKATPMYLTGNFGSAQSTDASQAGNYLSTGRGAITLTFSSAQKSLALLWGSIDTGNRITFGNGDTITGAEVQKLAAGFAGNGARGAGGSAYVIATEDNPFTTVTFSSSVVSFEFAGIVASSGAISTVPLPASAPMFGAALLALAGFGYGMNRWVAPKGNKAAKAA